MKVMPKNMMGKESNFRRKKQKTRPPQIRQKNTVTKARVARSETLKVSLCSANQANQAVQTRPNSSIIRRPLRNLLLTAAALDVLKKVVLKRKHPITPKIHRILLSKLAFKRLSFARIIGVLKMLWVDPHRPVGSNTSSGYG
jgi:hypothetical protein